MTQVLTTDFCSCGRPLHYTDPVVEREVRRLVAELGERVLIRTPYGAYRVPRHYIALHGIQSARLAELAALHGWPKVA